jgi:mono/diheme cytochrome c family protein
MNILYRNLLFAVVCTGSVFLTACMGSNISSATACPQLRDTELASAYIAAKQNPLSATPENIRSGEDLFQGSAQPVACAQCHGKRGDATGPMAKMFNPAPRNFTCTSTMASIPDGQLYWIIKNGSIGTSMPAFSELNDDQIWQLILYIRSFDTAQTN